MIEFVSRNNFGILISQQQHKRIIATHIPFICNENEKGLLLSSHMSKANEQWRTLEDADEVLLIFQGAHTYISSSWYDHINVPTWDYIAVHLYGKARLLNNEETINHLRELVDTHEASEKNPISLDAMGADYVAKEMKGLVAFEIQITDMYSAFKLSQNRDIKNLDLIIDALEQRQDENSLAIATALKGIKETKQHD